MTDRSDVRQFIAQGIACLEDARGKAGRVMLQPGMTDAEIRAQLDTLVAVAVDALEQFDAARDAVREGE